MIKKKLKELISELKKIKVQKVLVLDHQKRNDRKIFHAGAKLLASDYTLIKHLYLSIKALRQK